MIALLSSASIYFDWMGFNATLLNTIMGLLAIYLWLVSDKFSWVWSGFFIGIFWFWWMGISFIHYQMIWAVPFVVFIVGIIYAFLFFLLIWMVYSAQTYLKIHHLIGKSIVLLSLSYIHPFGFDWFKPELMFTNSYLGIEKWQFAIVVFSFVLMLHRKQLLFLFLIPLAYPYTLQFKNIAQVNPNIRVINTQTAVEEKWNPNYRTRDIDAIFKEIKRAVDERIEIIVFPESVFALYLNREPYILTALKNYSRHITIVTGGLYQENNKTMPRNSTYIFQNGHYRVADKVVLVPFGEQNPLPSWMGKWINKIFFDGAPDYVGAEAFTDYKINGVTYRNAICFEATSEKLYEGVPKNMIVLSNNGWLVPSIEPTLQKILLQYYSKKYGTTIYHSVNMSPAYIVHKGEIIK